MKRVFGKKKTQAPAPTLDQASAGIGGRVDQMDVKIAALDKELMGYRKKLNATKNPAAKKSIQKRAMDVLKRKKMVGFIMLYIVVVVVEMMIFCGFIRCKTKKSFIDFVLCVT